MEDAAATRVREFYERCGLGGSWLGASAPVPIGASVGHGAAGIAYALYRLAVARDDARLLAGAAGWVARATALAGGGAAAAFDGGPGSLLHGLAGTHAVRALVALAAGDAEAAGSAIGAFLETSRAPSDILEVGLGKAGLLIGAAELLDAVDPRVEDQRGALLARGAELEAELRRAALEGPLATSASLPFLGLAHGWAGVLFAGLRWSEATGASAEPYRAKLDELAALHELTPRGVRWPVANATVAERSYMAGWCHGLAGQTLLWALASERLGSPEYARLAEGTAAMAWVTAVDHGTLCCGLAGIGYAYAAVGRLTGEAVWTLRARIAASNACRDRAPDFAEESLYKGAVGAVLLQEELEAGSAAAPLVERPRQPTASPSLRTRYQEIA